MERGHVEGAEEEEFRTFRCKGRPGWAVGRVRPRAKDGDWIGKALLIGYTHITRPAVVMARLESYSPRQIRLARSQSRTKIRFPAGMQGRRHFASPWRKWENQEWDYRWGWCHRD